MCRRSDSQGWLMDGSTFEPLRFSPSRSYFSLLFFPHFSQFAQSFQPLLFSSCFYISYAMAKKQSVSFDEIIQSGTCSFHARTTRNLTSPSRLDRQKKQNEQLANQLLGKNRNKKDRRASAPAPGAVSKVPNAKPGSLASRIGVQKV